MQAPIYNPSHNCVVCGGPKMATIVHVNEEMIPTMWKNDSSFNIIGLPSNEYVEEVFCEGCGLTYHPSSVPGYDR